MGFTDIWKFSVCMFSWKFSDLTDIVLNQELQHFQASWYLKSVKIFPLCYCFSVRWASSSCLGAIFEPNFNLLISKDRPRLQRVPWGRGRTAQGSPNSHHFRKDSNEAHYKSSRQSHQVILKKSIVARLYPRRHYWAPFLKLSFYIYGIEIKMFLGPNLWCLVTSCPSLF